MNKFTNELKKELCYLINYDEILADSDIEDFCNDWGLSCDEVFHWLEEQIQEIIMKGLMGNDS